jgi:hypothetical protein
VPHTVRLPAALGVALGLRHVWQQVWTEAALLVQAAYDLASALSARRDGCGRGLDAGALRPTARPGALGLDERDELALGLGIALDVPLRHRQAGMPREFLDVPETPADLRDFAGGTRNEGAAAGM